MKAAFSLFIAFGVLAAVLAAAPSAPSADGKIKDLNECKVKEKATDDDVQAVLNNQIPKGPNGKCLLACAYEKNGSLMNGKVQPDVLAAVLMKDRGDDIKASDQINAIVADCKNVSHPDRCEQGFQLKNCVDKMTPARG